LSGDSPSLSSRPGIYRFVALGNKPLVCKLKAQRQEEGEHELAKCLAIAQQLKVGRFILKIDGEGPVCAWLFSPNYSST
jgi:hypothetical protein